MKMYSILGICYERIIFAVVNGWPLSDAMPAMLTHGLPSLIILVLPTNNVLKPSSLP